MQNADIRWTAKGFIWQAIDIGGGKKLVYLNFEKQQKAVAPSKGTNRKRSFWPDDYKTDTLFLVDERGVFHPVLPEFLSEDMQVSNTRLVWDAQKKKKVFSPESKFSKRLAVDMVCGDKRYRVMNTLKNFKNNSFPKEEKAIKKTARPLSPTELSRLYQKIKKNEFTLSRDLANEAVCYHLTGDKKFMKAPLPPPAVAALPIPIENPTH